MPERATRHLTVTVDGQDRDATWTQGVGIYVGGHDFGQGDTVEIEGTPHEVTDMRRMQMHDEAVTLILKAGVGETEVIHIKAPRPDRAFRSPVGPTGGTRRAVP